MTVLRLLLLSPLAFTVSTVAAQSIGPSAIDAAGGSATAGGNTYEYAIGQTIAGATASSASLVVTPGVLQPVFTTTGVAGPGIAEGDLRVYPSPVERTLFLTPAFKGGGVLQYSLYDAAGKLVLSREAVLKTGQERQEVGVSALAAGQYLLQVSWQQAGRAAYSGYKIQKLR